MRARPRPSLKARAIALLAQREHSRLELRRKLLSRLRDEARADALALAAVPRGEARDANADLEAKADLGPSADPGGPTAADPAATVDALLDWLEANDYLSAARFVESRVTARAARFGTSRIRQELVQHGVTLEPRDVQVLMASEFERARAVWLRRFGTAATEARERARQARFLAARGFSGDVIRRVVSGLADD